MSEIYTVQPGDYMDTIAKRFGFGEYHTIYDDSRVVFLLTALTFKISLFELIH
jgi:hypothetical protein